MAEKKAAKAAENKEVGVKEVNRLKKRYIEEVVPALKKHFDYKNVNRIPKLEKIVVNAGIGDAKDNSKSFQIAVEELKSITGQKPLVTHAKKSVANFKLREGQPVGAKVTLRNDRMYEFMDKLISIALPRVRDFRGINGNSFDGRGNYTMGVKEQHNFRDERAHRRRSQRAVEAHGNAFQGLSEVKKWQKNR